MVLVEQIQTGCRTTLRTQSVISTWFGHTGKSVFQDISDPRNDQEFA
jgi:hypothetical protein